MPASYFLRTAPALAALFILLGALAAPAAIDREHPTESVTVAQADTPAAPVEAEPAEALPASAEPRPEDLPRMTNKAAAFWGVAFMSSVCVAFSVLAGYAIYRTQQRKKP